MKRTRIWLGHESKALVIEVGPLKQWAQLNLLFCVLFIMWKQSKKPGEFLPNPIILVFQTQTFGFQNCCAPNQYFVMTLKKTNTIHRKEKYSLKKLKPEFKCNFQAIQPHECLLQYRVLHWYYQLCYTQELKGCPYRIHLSNHMI